MKPHKPAHIWRNIMQPVFCRKTFIVWWLVKEHYSLYSCISFFFLPFLLVNTHIRFDRRKIPKSCTYRVALSYGSSEDQWSSSLLVRHKMEVPWESPAGATAGVSLQYFSQWWEILQTAAGSLKLKRKLADSYSGNIQSSQEASASSLKILTRLLPVSHIQ